MDGGQNLILKGHRRHYRSGCAGMARKAGYNEKQIDQYLNFFMHPGCRALFIYRHHDRVAAAGTVDHGQEDKGGPQVEFWQSLKDIPAGQGYDLIILEHLLSRSEDIQALLKKIRPLAGCSALFMSTEYNLLWNSVLRCVGWLSGRRTAAMSNWLSHHDVKNICQLEGMEVFRHTRKTLVPCSIPLVSHFFNKIIGNLPLFNHLCINHFYFIRFLPNEIKAEETGYSVSIIIPARNEGGNIETVLNRIQAFGRDQEIIFVEGNSLDDTWQQVLRVKEKYKDRRILALQQTGQGKANAVQEAFRQASGDILMILDADISVCPEDLGRFYEALTARRGDFINGCRLVYKMEENAMRGFNLIGNKLFSILFSWLLQQPIKDTLCGTKVMFRKDYLALEKNRSYFGDFDPFGDFDLLFGAYKLGLKIVDLPVTYRARTYGKTNISRWKQGWVLLKMWLFAVNKIMFNP